MCAVHDYSLTNLRQQPTSYIAATLQYKIARLHSLLVYNPFLSPTENKAAWKSQRFKDSIALLDELCGNVMWLANNNRAPLTENVEKTEISSHILAMANQSTIQLFDTIPEHLSVNAAFKDAYSRFIQHKNDYLENPSHLCVASFNMQQFGASKQRDWSNDKLVKEVLMNVLFPFDIIALQEVDQGEAVRNLLNRFNLSDMFSLFYSRNCKEAILVRHAEERFEHVEIVKELTQYGSVNYTCGFLTIKITKKNKECFYVTSVHLSPQDITAEYSYMLQSFEVYSEDWFKEDWIVAGDCNFSTESARMGWLFENDKLHGDADFIQRSTTPSGKVYDLIRVSQSLSAGTEEAMIHGVISFPEKSPGRLFKPQGGIISNHFPVYMIVKDFFGDDEKVETEKEEDDPDYVPPEEEVVKKEADEESSQ